MDSTTVKDPIKVAAGRAGARARWGDGPRVVRMGDLSPDQRRLVAALVEAARSASGKRDPAPEPSN